MADGQSLGVPLEQPLSYATPGRFRDMREGGKCGTDYGVSMLTKKCGVQWWRERKNDSRLTNGLGQIQMQTSVCEPTHLHMYSTQT
jgi:hypothetical protein